MVAVVIVGATSALDVLDVSTGTAVESDVFSGEDAAIVDHNHRSAVDALLVWQLVVVAIVAYHLDGRAVGAGDVYRCVVNNYGIHDAQHIALLVDTVFQSLAEALHVEAGGLADLTLLEAGAVV